MVHAMQGRGLSTRSNHTHSSLSVSYQYAQVVVSGTNKGAVRFVNSAFWGRSNQIASINGTSTASTGFDSCIFNAWDAIGQNRSAIQVSYLG